MKRSERRGGGGQGGDFGGGGDVRRWRRRRRPARGGGSGGGRVPDAGAAPAATTSATTKSPSRRRRRPARERREPWQEIENGAARTRRPPTEAHAQEEGVDPQPGQDRLGRLQGRQPAPPVHVGAGEDPGPPGDRQQRSSSSARSPRAIRIAREMALLPYSVRQVTQRSRSGRRDRATVLDPTAPMPTPDAPPPIAAEGEELPEGVPLEGVSMRRGRGERRDRGGRRTPRRSRASTEG